MDAQRLHEDSTTTNARRNKPTHPDGAAGVRAGQNAHGRSASLHVDLAQLKIDKFPTTDAPFVIPQIGGETE